MPEEFDALIQNGTWKLVPPQPGSNLVDCKWVFKIKRHADGSIEHDKACLIAKGFSQPYGLDYAETFNPVIKLMTVRLILSIAVSKKGGVSGKLMSKMLSSIVSYKKLFT
jgi:hypothetical protein